MWRFEEKLTCRKYVNTFEIQNEGASYVWNTEYTERKRVGETTYAENVSTWAASVTLRYEKPVDRAALLDTERPTALFVLLLLFCPYGWHCRCRTIRLPFSWELNIGQFGWVFVAFPHFVVVSVHLLFIIIRIFCSSCVFTFFDRAPFQNVSWNLCSKNFWFLFFANIIQKHKCCDSVFKPFI